MTADRWALLRAILDEAFERPAAERAALLDRRCADDPGLRSEIESLLAADARADADAILRAPVDAVAAAALADAPPEGASSGWAGRTVGAYRITRLLGEGGMGIVFEAEQANPQRLVALKVVRTGPFVDDVRLRLFQRESEALARLQHPGIAAIFEAGRTPEGQHYFVMELARGVPLHERLRGRPSPADTAERRFRLELFLEIADAIAYAHRRGVIHRDLKPSNVMVDADGRVKILDFGLARITDGDVALSTVVTERAVIQGTLPYMSPEQARGDPSAIDLRSDVYSLGVLLFEMLTGELPLPIRDAALPEAVRAILDDAPRRPSAIVPALRGDLETVAAKALAKDPADRYGSVDALAEDVRRHLDDQPILARPPSSMEQIRRFGRRHRVAASFALAALVALVAGIAGTTTAMLRARAAERSAREEASTADAISGFLVDLFLVSDPGEARGNSITARELLDRGVAEVDSALADQPQVRGRLLGTMGQVYRNLGLYGEALPLLERSLEVRESNPREDPLQIARSHYSLAGLLRRLGRYDAARGHYESALRIRERSRAPEEEVAASLMGLANLHYDLAEFEDAAPLYERARELARTSLGEDHFDYPSFVAGLAFVNYQLGQGEEACTLFEEVARRREKALGPDHPTLAYDLRTWAMVLNDLGRIDEARPVAERALALAERTLGPEHAFVGEALNTLGRTRAAAGDPDTAAAMHRRALAITQRVYGDAHPLTAETKDLLAADLLALGRPAEALAICAEADSVAAAMPADHPSRRDHDRLRARLVAAVAERPGT